MSSPLENSKRGWDRFEKSYVGIYNLVGILKGWRGAKTKELGTGEQGKRLYMEYLINGSKSLLPLRVNIYRMDWEHRAQETTGNNHR